MGETFVGGSHPDAWADVAATHSTTAVAVKLAAAILMGRRVLISVAP
jgi:hypothetical protein